MVAPADTPAVRKFRLTRRQLLLAGSAATAGAVSVYLAADTGAKPRSRPEWLTPLYPFEDRWFEVDGNTVHYIDEGSGPAMLFLHGNPTGSFLYRNIIRELRTEFRCIAVDYPGFGLSTARDGYGFTPAEHSRVVEKLVLALDLRDLTVMVQDWGGPIGLGLAGRQSERVRALVIGNTWAWPAQGDVQLERFADLVGGPIGTFFIRYFDAFVNVFIPIGTARTLSAEEMNAYRLPFPTRESRRPAEIFPREITASAAYLAEVEAGLARLSDRPTLIVWGERDFAFQQRHRARFEDLFPQHRSVLLPSARHFIQEDEPEQIATEIRRLRSAVDSQKR
jgi:haloalkane dehalogenase